MSGSSRAQVWSIGKPGYGFQGARQNLGSNRALHTVHEQWAKSQWSLQLWQDFGWEPVVRQSHPAVDHLHWTCPWKSIDCRALSSCWVLHAQSCYIWGNRSTWAQQTRPKSHIRGRSIFHLEVPLSRCYSRRARPDCWSQQSKSFHQETPRLKIKNLLLKR